MMKILMRESGSWLWWVLVWGVDAGNCAPIFGPIDVQRVLVARSSPAALKVQPMWSHKHQCQLVGVVRLVDIEHHDHDVDLRTCVSAAQRDARAGRRAPSAVHCCGEPGQRGRSRWGRSHGAIPVFTGLLSTALQDYDQ